MRELFDLDMKDYDPGLPRFSRPSVRAIIIRGERIAMVHSRKYDYYKFPGGGIQGNETHPETLARETREEAGLTVRPETVRKYGLVSRRQKDWFSEMVFEQVNYYYLCETEADLQPQQLDDYEDEEGFTLEWVDPRMAIAVNRERDHGPKDKVMVNREASVLEMLLQEGYFPFPHSQP